MKSTWISVPFSWVFVALATPPVVEVPLSALESGTYDTAAGATMLEQGDRVANRSRIVPITATFTFDLESMPPSMVAVLKNAVLEGGEPFPLTVRSTSGFQFMDGTYAFSGDYLQDLYPNGTQYIFDWNFKASTNGTVLWNGTTFWAGGHIWFLEMTNIRLVPRPTMTIVYERPAVVISWPNVEGAPTFVLERTATLTTNGTGGSWVPVLNPVETGPQGYFVRVAATAAQGYFRLRRP
jgi:hypothetical protein